MKVLTERTRLTGWVLLPLRIFLGVTFCFAGLQKLADPRFFQANAPTSIQTQMHGAATNSPIGGLLASGGHHPVALGILVAFGELAVGVGALLGLWTRVAALGGMALSLGFLLAVSWHSSPYYLGPDIVFLVAWTPLAIAGAGGVYSLDHRLRNKARHELKLAPAGPVTIEFAAVRKLCGAFAHGRCDLRDGAPCHAAACPVLLSPPRLKAPVAAELDRRTFMRQASAAGAAAVGALAAGGLAAGLGRLFSGGRDRGVAASATTVPADSTTSVPPPRSTPAAAARNAPRPTVPSTVPIPPGSPVARAADVPVGGALRFRDPRTGGRSYLVQPQAGHYAAFSGICTHEGCGVDFTGSAFACPCHGAEFSAASGQVLRGPARQPLAESSVALGPDGRLYVDG